MTTQGLPVVINAFASDFWMWGATLCRVYACIGGIFGVASIMTMVVIGYDRYNVIVKGFKGTKITFGKGAIIIIFVWIYAALGCCPPFLGWGGYALGNTFKLVHTYFNPMVPIKCTVCTLQLCNAENVKCTVLCTTYSVFDQFSGRFSKKDNSGCWCFKSAQKIAPATVGQRFTQ